MTKAYLFEAQKASKVYGDSTPTEKMIIVVGAQDKAFALEQARKSAQGLRIVNAGKAYKDEAAATARVTEHNKLTESLIAKGFTQYGGVAQCVVVNLNTQRGIAKLLGL